MTLKDEIDKLHEYSSFRDFQMAVQRIFQGMTEGIPITAEEMIAPQQSAAESQMAPPAEGERL